MNIANCLTIFRIILIPFFVFFLSNVNKYKEFNFYFFATVIFVIATITDALDGFIARKYKLITNLGKFLDPIADKLLVLSAFLCFLEWNLVNVWHILIIITREFLVMFLRLIASNKNLVIAANFWGKLKTVSQFLACITGLISIGTNKFASHAIYTILCINFVNLSTALTVVSGFIYFFQNKKILKIYFKN